MSSTFVLAQASFEIDFQADAMLADVKLAIAVGADGSMCSSTFLVHVACFLPELGSPSTIWFGFVLLFTGFVIFKPHICWNDGLEPPETTHRCLCGKCCVKSHARIAVGHWLHVQCRGVAAPPRASCRARPGGHLLGGFPDPGGGCGLFEQFTCNL